jgi:hypothetical protein
MEKALLSLTYLGPIQYFSKFLLFKEIWIEQWENYQKQSYRNRCYIYGANGKLCLVIPVVHKHNLKMPIRDVKIDYSTPWQKIHWKSIESAYRLSPYFDYLADLFAPYFEKARHIKFLFDFNYELLTVLLSVLKIEDTPSLTSSYEKNPSGIIDYRGSIHPKKRLLKPDPLFTSIQYQQVFKEKYGFLSNLSIIDLLFNEGSHAKDIINTTILPSEC